MLILILIFAPSLSWRRITCHYYNNAWRLLWFDHGSSPLEKDGTGLWQRRCWPLWFKVVGMHDDVGVGIHGGGEQQLRSGPESLAEAEHVSQWRKCTVEE
jgi:hypothetical protein